MENKNNHLLNNYTEKVIMLSVRVALGNYPKLQKTRYTAVSR